MFSVNTRSHNHFGGYYAQIKIKNLIFNIDLFLELLFYMEMSTIRHTGRMGAIALRSEDCPETAPGELVGA